MPETCNREFESIRTLNVKKIRNKLNLLDPTEAVRRCKEDTPDSKAPVKKHRRSSSSQSSTSSSSSSSGSNTSQESKESITPFVNQNEDRQLFIGGNKMFQVRSVSINDDKKSYNYIIVNTICDELKNTLRENDVIISVNGEDVKDKNSDDVGRIFDQLKPINEQYVVVMTVWRWSSNEEIEERTIQMRQMRHTTAITFAVPPARQNNPPTQRDIKSFEYTSDWNTISIRIADSAGLYVCVLEIDSKLVLKGMVHRDDIPEENYKFRIKCFRCFVNDTRRPRQYILKVGFIMSCTISGVNYDITTRLAEGDDELQLKHHTEFLSLDERYFAAYDFGDEDMIFESLLFKDHCVKYDHITTLLTVDKLGISRPKSKRSTVTPSYKLQMFNLAEKEKVLRRRIRHKKYNAPVQRFDNRIHGPSLISCCWPFQRDDIRQLDGEISKDNVFLIETPSNVT